MMGQILGSRRNACGSLIGAGCAAEAKIDAAPVKRFQRTELLCDDQRRMVWQHHAARSNTNGPGAAGDIADHHRGRSAGDAAHIVMLSHPEAPKAQLVGRSGEFGAGQHRVPRALPATYGGEVQH